MRVLWISSHGGNYKSNVVKGTCGWVGALQEVLLHKRKDIELAIAFPHLKDEEAIVDGNVTYYPILQKASYSSWERIKLKFRINVDKYDELVELTVDNLLRIISDFKPDLVHVWGVENMYSAIIPHIKDKVPVVVHIQGLTSVYLHSYAPPFVSVNDIFNSNGKLRRWKGTSACMNHYKQFVKRAENELHVSKHVKYWIGRTDWDQEISRFLSPNSQYFHCDEVLRKDFVDNITWKYHFDDNELNIISLISCDWYKGLDIVLGISKILNDSGIKFSWKIFGWTKDSAIAKTLIKKSNIHLSDLNIHFMGNVPAEEIKRELLKADVFVHPSYIENSSNAIAEAMITGVPIVANDVGGNASMLKDKSGILVPANDPYLMASKIMSLRNPSLAESLSQHALETARRRHDEEKVVSDLVTIYETILDREK